MGLQYKIFKGGSTLTETAAAAFAIPLVVIDMVSRDREGNITEHLRIHPDGREEVLISRR